MQSVYKACECGHLLSTRIDALIGNVRALADGCSRKAKGIEDPELYAALTGVLERMNGALELFWDQHGEPSASATLEGVEYAWGRRG